MSAKISVADALIGSVSCLGYIFTDNYIHNAKNNRYKALLLYPGDEQIESELYQIKEWQKKPFTVQVKEFRDLPSELTKYA